MEVETQDETGGNGRAREKERESVEKCCFCLQNDLKEPSKCESVLPLKKPGLRHSSRLSEKSNIRFKRK